MGLKAWRVEVSLGWSPSSGPHRCLVNKGGVRSRRENEEWPSKLPASPSPHSIERL